MRHNTNSNENNFTTFKMCEWNATGEETTENAKPGWGEKQWGYSFKAQSYCFEGLKNTLNLVVKKGPF